MRRRLRVLVAVAGVAPVPGDPLVVVTVEDDEHVDDGRRGRDDHDVLRPVRRPRVAGRLGRGPLRDRPQQRVAARTAQAGHAAGVDEDGGARLEDRLIAGGGAVAVAVVGDAGVHTQLYGGERAQICGNCGRLDAVHRGERLVPRRVRLERADLLLHIAAGDVAGAGVETGRGTVHAARHMGGLRRRRRRGCHGRGGTVGRRRLGERVGAGLARGLEEDLTAGALAATAVAVGEDEPQDHRGGHDTGEDRDAGRRLPPGVPVPGALARLPRPGGTTTGPGGSTRTARSAPRSAVTGAGGTAGRFRGHTADRLGRGGFGRARLLRTRQRTRRRSGGAA